jgi:hypothetical protein
VATSGCARDLRRAPAKDLGEESPCVRQRGPATLPGHLFVRVEESDTELLPHWAVTEPEKGWQILVRIERPGVAPEKRGALEGWEATPHQQMERLLSETGVARWHEPDDASVKSGSVRGSG